MAAGMLVAGQGCGGARQPRRLSRGGLTLPTRHQAQTRSTSQFVCGQQRRPPIASSARDAQAALDDSQDAQQPPLPGGQLVDPNVWAYKPRWCQPWSILATGAGLVCAAWALSGRSPGWAAAAAVPVAAWWGLFLVVMPAQFREQAEAANAVLRQREAQQRAAQQRGGQQGQQTQQQQQ